MTPFEEIEMDIEYGHDLTNVDWPALKSTLAADHFDNGRTPDQLARSFANSHSAVLAYAGPRIIGTARVLSDGVCNAYVVDVWTLTEYRRRGIAREILRRLLAPLRGQHVYLFTDDNVPFYKACGFRERPTGLELVVGEWLKGDEA
jgi:ribosomal protein S18 acetylase RimI-like enzyme